MGYFSLFYLKKIKALLRFYRYRALLTLPVFKQRVQTLVFRGVPSTRILIL